MKDDIFTTNDIAQMLKVDISTVIDWVDRGRLPAYRTPGGHRRVKRTDLFAFIQNHKLPFPEELSRPTKIILLVEDDKDFRKMIRGYVEEASLPVKIEEAEDGFMAGKLVE
jgi:excisionase family DNA binding protein